MGIDIEALIDNCQWAVHEVIMMLAVSFWVGQIVGQTIGTVLALCYLPNWWAVSFLAFQVSNQQTCCAYSSIVIPDSS